jgi:hypothetical protein
MVFCVVTCVNVVDTRVSEEHAKCIFTIKVKGKDVVTLCRHVSVKVLTEIHRWTLQSEAA